METHSRLAASQWTCERDGGGEDWPVLSRRILETLHGIAFGNREGIFS